MKSALAALLSLTLTAAAQDLHVPAFTAYLQPNVSAARVDKNGITNWSTDDTILWAGVLSPGQLHAAVVVQLPAGQTSKLKLTLAGHAATADAKGTGQPVTVDFGAFTIPATPGYQRIELSESSPAPLDVRELLLTGPATKNAFFNLKTRRNAPSVHLHYPIPRDAQVAAFYNEVTPQTDPVATYYEACGFARGYFGMQVNSPTERRIIFSVWDAGSEATDRKKVADDNRVKLLAKGDGVVAGDFGNEGTGGHSHLIYPWKLGQTCRFLVTAKADGDATVYTGYFFFPDRNAWGLIASFRAPHDGKLLRGLYSFNENFNGNNGCLQRLCHFGNQWIQTTDGKWTELTTATFTTDPTGQKDRHDFAAGVARDGTFYLGNGGFIAEPIKPNQSLTRPPTHQPPTDLKLPSL